MLLATADDSLLANAIAFVSPHLRNRMMDGAEWLVVANMNLWLISRFLLKFFGNPHRMGLAAVSIEGSCYNLLIDILEHCN